MAETEVLRGRLTTQQAAVLTTIRQLGKEKDYAPSVREIQEHLGYASPSTVHAHLARLRHMGAVDWLDDQPRTLHLTLVGKAALSHRIVL